MTYKQIEASRERRLWLVQVVIPVGGMVGMAMSQPEIRQAAGKAVHKANVKLQAKKQAAANAVDKIKAKIKAKIQPKKDIEIVVVDDTD